MGRASRQNPTAIAAREGQLPPKKPKMGAKESDRIIKAAVWAKMQEKCPILNTFTRNYFDI
jgi:hypothetical protein